MKPIDDHTLKDQLRNMDETLTFLIGLADGQRDYLLGALLSQAHAHVVKQYAIIASK